MITSGDGFIHLYPCAVQSQDCIRVVVDSGVTNISNFWLRQGDTQSQQHGATYPAQWSVNSPQDVEITSTSGDWPTQWGDVGGTVGGLAVYYSNYGSLYGWANGTSPTYFYFVNGCPSYTEADTCTEQLATTTVTATIDTNVVWMLAVIIFMIGFMFWGFVINNLMPKDNAYRVG